VPPGSFPISLHYPRVVGYDGKWPGAPMHRTSTVRLEGSDHPSYKVLKLDSAGDSR
jgi:hypothetical protein